ncbi:MAG: hypothetical protein U5K84_13590 [Alkalibacterium sp.]|nr:hypothetical protein [Alkalibacterium sp.]
MTPEVAVVTSIGMDHTRLLGETLEKIAGEKAGILERDQGCRPAGFHFFDKPRI